MSETIPEVTPLRIDRSKFAPTRGEKVCMFIPIIGWLIGNALFEKRALGIRRSLDEQLMSRPDVSNAWHGHVASTSFALELCSLICNHTGSATASFIPTDDMDVVFFDDELACMNVLEDLRDKYRIAYHDLPNEMFWEYDSTTLGSFIRAVEQRMSHGLSQPIAE